MKYKYENTILKFIKYAPFLFSFSIFIIISIFLYMDYKNNFKKEKKEIEEKYIQQKKEQLKSDIQKINNYIFKIQEEMEEELKVQLKNRVYEAYNIANRIYLENKTKPKNEIIKMIKDALVDIKFLEGRGYFYIYTFDYKCILLPVARHLEGTNFYNFKEGKGNYLTRQIVSQVKEEKEGFLKWWYHKPSDMTNQYKKIGFNKHFEPFDWFIGTGEYFIDYENTVKQKVLNYIKKQQYKNEYIFVLDTKGNYLYHPTKEYIQKNAKEIKNISTKSLQYIIDTSLNKKSGYITYTQNKRFDNQKNKTKTTYFEIITNWDWIIGKGFYEDEVNKIIKERKNILDKQFDHYLKNIILIFLFSTIFILLISIFISKTLENVFKKYKKSINEYIKEHSKQQEYLAQQSKLASMGEMLGNIAHQWRQPLSLISTVSTGLKFKKEFYSLTNEELEEGLDNINHTAQYLSKTINDFSDFYKNNKEISIFSSKEIINKTLELINIVLKNRNIKVIEEVEEFNFNTIKNELIQVLINILNNAKDAFSNNNTKDKIILIEIKKDNHMAIIKIKDNAGGIKEKIINRIFEPYFTTKHQSQGTGIGLYMSEQIIVRSMKGEIKAYNENFLYKQQKYFGAVFEIIIPISLIKE
ncbi:histidine kinase [Malaciobacter mytili]|uniref:sensor histidine kinase n=1 Tax=Malaciobacter mytili TaxID=603050 RepID=UPI00100A4878|nr:cache domain-containing protein [Malaciobacter mytili]RXI36119.1 histidine kinase [Malaciobacter mytili]